MVMSDGPGVGVGDSRIDSRGYRPLLLRADIIEAMDAAEVVGSHPRVRGEAAGSDNGTLWDPRGAFGLERGGEGLADLGGGGADGQGDGPGNYRPPGRSAPRRPGLRTL